MIAVILIAIMIVTRLPVLAGFLHVADASWAVFFLAGYWLPERWRWMFPALIATAVAIDLIAIEWMGVPNYCLTRAYWFIVPGYASLWLGGALLRRHASGDLRGVGVALLALLTSASLCFLVTNASFFWLGERVAAPTWDGWIENFMRWYWPFVRTTLIHAGPVVLVRLLLYGGGAEAVGRKRAKQ
jgi:hypothetical protein